MGNLYNHAENSFSSHCYLTWVDVDHKLDDFEKTDIPDEVREALKFAFDNEWQVWAFLWEFVLTEVLDGTVEYLVHSVTPQESVGVITCTEKHGCGERWVEEECERAFVAWTGLEALDADISVTDGRYGLFNMVLSHLSVVKVFLEIKVSWTFVDALFSDPPFKHNPESPWLFFSSTAFSTEKKVV